MLSYDTDDVARFVFELAHYEPGAFVTAGREDLMVAYRRIRGELLRRNVKLGAVELPDIPNDDVLSHEVSREIARAPCELVSLGLSEEDDCLRVTIEGRRWQWVRYRHPGPGLSRLGKDHRKLLLRSAYAGLIRYLERKMAMVEW